MNEASTIKPPFERRQQIIDVAEKICREQGLQKMSLRGIAKKIVLVT